jgi:hypothetical protein
MLVPPEMRRKSSSSESRKSVDCRFTGFDYPNMKSFVLLKENGKFATSRHVLFDESAPPDLLILVLISLIISNIHTR